MAQIYGELIRAQLQLSASDLASPVAGLAYFKTDTKTLRFYKGVSDGWSEAVDLTAVQQLDNKTLSSSCSVNVTALPTIPPSKGGTGHDASSWTGLLRVVSGSFSPSQLLLTDIPDALITYAKLNLADADIPQAKVSGLVTDLASKVDENAPITGATKTKITYDAKGLVTAGADLVSDDIPATLLSKVVSSTAAVTGALTLPAGSTADRTGLSTVGMIRFNTTDNTFEGYNGTVWGAIGGGGGGTVVTIVQANTFNKGDVVYLNGSTYTKAIATAANTAEVVGVVSAASAGSFELTLSGEVDGLSGLVAGEVYFLSAATPGALTTTEPSTIGQVSVPVGVASSTTSLFVAPKRGTVVGGVNARTEVALTSAATTNVQNVAGMSAGELTGWVFINSSPAKRFYIAAQFALSGAGGDYNLSYQTSGDVPPTGFLMDITTGGMIRVTLPAASGTTSSINYALNAPAIGASFPLTVNADTILSGTVNSARLPAPTAYSDVVATRMGLKQYVHGGSYTGSPNAPTITLSANLDGTSPIPLTNARGTFIPYQLSDGTWRMKFNFQTVANSTYLSGAFNIAGVSFAAGAFGTLGQALSHTNGDGLSKYAIARSDYAGKIQHAGTNARSEWSISGDVELTTKPTWAY